MNQRLIWMVLLATLLLGCDRTEPEAYTKKPASDANVALVQKMLDNPQRKIEFDDNGLRYSVCYGCGNAPNGICFKTRPLDVASDKLEQEYCDEEMDGKVDFGMQGDFGKTPYGKSKLFYKDIASETFRLFWQKELRDAIVATLKHNGQRPVKPLLDPNVIEIVELQLKPLPNEDPAGRAIQFTAEGMTYWLIHGDQPTPGLCFATQPVRSSDEKQKKEFCDSDLDGVVDYGAQGTPKQSGKDRKYFLNDPESEDQKLPAENYQTQWQAELDRAVAVTLKHYRKTALPIDRDF